MFNNMLVTRTNTLGLSKFFAFALCHVHALWYICYSHNNIYIRNGYYLTLNKCIMKQPIHISNFGITIDGPHFILLSFLSIGTNNNYGDYYSRPIFSVYRKAIIQPAILNHLQL
ncbi:unnamed protein product [Meganyctiphanes norvegica]|uniref:Uncharacterized protein n=1 Tax=Meganyctiphanes norvegica TaxID=48144 RepID=A0AAV2RHX4_MEGNR